MNRKLIIQGRRELSGEYWIQGNKNAALPLISAALLSRAPVIFRKVPKIVDVENLLQVVRALGVGVKWDDQTLHLEPQKLTRGELPRELVEKLRGSILLLGALAPQVEEISSSLPGGCPIGRRSFDMHWSAFRAAGYSVEQTAQRFEIRRVHRVPNPTIYLEESSVTATENALILLSALGGGTIQNPAREPHVLSLVSFLRKLGCEIELHPLYYRITRGPNPEAGPVDLDVPADSIDAGTVAIAAAVTGGSVRIRGVGVEDLLGIYPVLERFGIHFHPIDDDTFEVDSTARSSPSRIVAGPWPSFPTDLMSLAIVLATQSTGICLLHDWMYEARMFFIDKLVRMGARITMCDPHRVLVEGPTLLRGVNLESPDIRAGMALVVAGLCAEGTTTIEHAEVIARGYQDVATRLRAIGADITEATEPEYAVS